MKLFLGIPTGGSPTAPFLDSLQRVDLPANVTSIDRLVVSGNFVPGQRELIAERAIESEADILVMCDDDMVLPQDALVRLCGLLAEQQDAALAGALYYSRDGFRPMVVDNWSAEDTTSAVVPAFDDRTPVAVSGVGFGCVAIRVSALRALTAPFFPTQIFVERGAARVRVCNEDYLFCNRLNGGGWKVFLDPAVRCGHYDRASGQVFPHTWEPPHVTLSRRMAVLENGELRLVPAREDTHRVTEQHMKASVEYLFVD